MLNHYKKTLRSLKKPRLLKYVYSEVCVGVSECEREKEKEKEKERDK
jgi:hypothetical protein